MAEKVADAMWRWSEEGRLPVVVDASSCTHGLRQDVVGRLSEEASERHQRIALVDSVAWVNDTLLPRLSVTRKLGSLAVHPTCSGRHLGVTSTMLTLLRSVADEVVVPLGASCCGMAGDRGLLHPELVQSALREEAASLLTRQYDAYVSSNRTCELALHQVTGRKYLAAVSLVEELMRP